MPAKVNVSGAQRGSAGSAASCVGPTAAQIGGHRDVDELRMRQAEVVHVADEVGFADLAAAGAD